ncbi:tail assembly chaperone protein [Pseudomonas phage EM]|uniref:Tail assembly chaperone protein n=1 Tax=Pseudomonas phage EM TaxID=2936914 RepID=A0AAE9HG46_9CAUD|nr:tail assembly chaperone protein [Pseudomonas phage EM]UPW35889.1 tail assembly chaperone protein [Pseudomonas phage EM]
MEFRNVVRYKDGFECEINHPEWGWSPYYACDYDVHAKVVYDLIVDAIQSGDIPEPEDQSNKYEDFEARVWRDAELKRADLKVENAIDDEDPVKEKAWRKYRSALRKWPDHKDFPKEKSKPKAPKE